MRDDCNNMRSYRMRSEPAFFSVYCDHQELLLALSPGECAGEPMAMDPFIRNSSVRDGLSAD